MDFKLKADFIELDNLLKNLDLAKSGAEAREIILSGLVKVNGEVETRIRKKIRLSDSVEYKEQKIIVVV